MSKTYAQFPNTTFPDVIQSFDSYIDITQDDAVRYEAAVQAMLSGNLTMAQNLLNSIPNIKQKALTSEKLNTLIDTVQALELIFQSGEIQKVIQPFQTDWKNYIDRFRYVGEWKNTTNYLKNNMVSYASSAPNTDVTKYLYIAVTNQSGSATAINPYTDYENTFAIGQMGTWYRITIRGKDGESGASASSVSFRYAWSDTESYVKNDIVVSDDGWWIATQPNQGSKPSASSADWELIAHMEGGLAQYPVQANQPTGQRIGDLWFQIIT